MSVCEGQPDRAWTRHIVCVSLENAKFFMLPCGKSLYPIKLELLKSSVEAIMRSIGNMLTEVYAEDYMLFSVAPKTNFVQI